MQIIISYVNLPPEVIHGNWARTQVKENFNSTKLN
jgi:hypothetical protein